MEVFVDHLAALLGRKALQPRMMTRMGLLRNETVGTKMTDTHRYASYLRVFPQTTFSLRLPALTCNHLSGKLLAKLISIAEERQCHYNAPPTRRALASTPPAVSFVSKKLRQ